MQKIPTHDFDPEFSKKTRVVKLGAKTNYNFGVPHRHNYLELFFFQNGSGDHEIDFVNFPIEPCSIHLVGADRVHQVRRGIDSTGFVVLFSPEIFDSNSVVGNFLFNQSLLDVSEHNPCFAFNDKQELLIQGIVERIWDDYNSDHPLKFELVSTNLNMLLLECMRHSDYSLQSVQGQQPYVEFRKLLKSNFKEMKKVKDYANALNLTEKKLNEIVSEKTGKSTSALIYRQLILEAKRLLNTGISSKETAYELNFDDPAHFSKFFKAQTGQSPSEFTKTS
ncbi:MAG: helix-turn-helix domain-containing protein [Crocinitomicaceae bacterium]|nr:helix-turn-helix domain-containing protein [Crocinitomicaceae bacterium]